MSLIKRKMVVDSKTGVEREIAMVRVVGNDGRPKVVAVDAQRFDQFNARMAHIMAGDATEALAHYVSQLAYTEAQMFEREYTQEQYKDLVPVSYEAGPWAESVEYQIFDKVGKGRRLSPSARDIPRVDAAFARKVIAVQGGGIGYAYTQQELRASAQLKRPLNDIRMGIAVEAFERHMNEVALVGESDSGLTGLFNKPVTGDNAVPHADATTGDWDNPATSVDSILADVNIGMVAVWTNTNYNSTVNTVVLPPKAFAALATRPRATNSDLTVLEFLKRSNIATASKGVQVNFVPGFGLDTGGPSNKSRVVYYEKDPKRLVMHIPLPLQFLAPQLEGYDVVIPGEYRYAGVELRYCKSMYYQEKVLAAD